MSKIELHEINRYQQAHVGRKRGVSLFLHVHIPLGGQAGTGREISLSASSLSWNKLPVVSKPGKRSTQLVVGIDSDGMSPSVYRLKAKLDRWCNTHSL